MTRPQTLMLLICLGLMNAGLPALDARRPDY